MRGDCFLMDPVLFDCLFRNDDVLSWQLSTYFVKKCIIILVAQK